MQSPDSTRLRATGWPASLLLALAIPACTSAIETGSADAGSLDAGEGGVPLDSRCAIPPGASALIQLGLPAEGLHCTRYPFPLASPRDVIESADGTIYVSAFGAGTIVALTDSGFSSVATGLTAPIGLREESVGALLVAEEAAQTLARIDLATGARTVIAGDLHNVTYLAMGPDGAAYVSSFEALADTNQGVVHRIDTATGAATLFATGLDVPEGLFFDLSGALVVADWLPTSAIYRFPPEGGDLAEASTIAKGFENVYGVAGDGADGLYASDHAGRVVHIAKNGMQRDVVTGIARPAGLWRTKEGDLLIAELVDFGQTGYLVRISGL